MQKINFQNLPDTTTPVNATNLNQLQTNVENEFTSVESQLIYYDEGTFTPYLEGETTAGTATYIFRYGGYVRIGKCIFYNFRIGVSSFTGSSGLLLIKGFPNYSYIEPGANSVVFSKSATYFGGTCCITRIFGRNLIIDGGDLSNVSNANWSDNTYIYGSGVLIIE